MSPRSSPILHADPPRWTESTRIPMLGVSSGAGTVRGDSFTRLPSKPSRGCLDDSWPKAAADAKTTIAPSHSPTARRAGQDAHAPHIKRLLSMKVCCCSDERQPCSRPITGWPGLQTLPSLRAACSPNHTPVYSAMLACQIRSPVFARLPTRLPGSLHRPCEKIGWFTWRQRRFPARLRQRHRSGPVAKQVEDYPLPKVRKDHAS